MPPQLRFSLEGLVASVTPFRCGVDPTMPCSHGGPASSKTGSPTQPTPIKPFETIRDGGLKATIWKNPPKEGTETGPFYSVQITRTWRDQQGTYHDSDRFSGTEPLRVARLANLAYDAIVAQRAADRKAQQAEL